MEERVPLSSEAKRWLVRLNQAGTQGMPLAEVPLEVVAELAGNAPDFYRRLRIRLDR